MFPRRRIDGNRERHYRRPLLVITVSACSLLFGACHQAELPGSDSLGPVAVTFDSHGSALQGIFFPANVNPPTATVLLLHGFPGNDKEPLGLGTRMMHEGINALAFNYRGTWASEGEFDPDRALEDVGSAMSFLSSPAMVERHGIDTGSMFVAGSSFGGCMALAFSAREPSVNKVIAVVALDLSSYAALLENNPDARAGWIAMMDELTSPSGMIRGQRGEASYEWVRSNAGRYDPASTAGELATKDLLLIGGWRDTETPIESHLLPLVRALQTHDAGQLTIEMLDDDHDLGETRDALADRIVSWIGERTAALGQVTGQAFPETPSDVLASDPR